MQIGAWVQMYESDLPIIGNWLAIRGIDVKEYVAMLCNNCCSADGLEVWIASMALGQPLNVVLRALYGPPHRTVLTMHTHLLELLTDYGEAILCEQEPEEDSDDLSHLGAATPPVVGK